MNPPNKTILIDCIKKMEEITHKENVVIFLLKANESDTGCKGNLKNLSSSPCLQINLIQRYLNVLNTVR